jgi:hypothetical protein
MAEELVLDVKSNIKSVTKETKDWAKSLEEVNEQISIQESVITDLEKDLIKLKAQQDAIPKGAYVQGMDKLNRKIKETSTELKLEKVALKELTGQQKEASKEVKKSTAAQKENNKESKESIANFQFMGVSLNGVKKGFQQVIPTAKAMFGTIKAGIMSTGIGALVLAVAALTQSFKRSEAGQEKFQRIMAGIGAVTSQVLDLFSDLGEAIIDTVTSPMKALESFGNGIVKFVSDPIGATRDLFVEATVAVKNFVGETKQEIEAIDEVTKARQEAHRIDRQLKVERAKANREINDIRLQAEDREKFNATERIALLRKAQKIEEDITAKEIKSKKLLVEAQRLENEQNLTDIANKDKLAQLEADLINLDTKKLRSQRLLQTQITTAINQEMAARKENQVELEMLVDENIDLNDKIIQADNKALDNYLSNNEKRKKSDEAMKVAKLGVTSAIGGAVGALGNLMAEGTAASKAAALAEIAINTGVGLIQGLDIAQKSAKATGPGAALAFPLFYATQVAAVLGAASQAKQILGSGGGGGGGGSVSAPATAQVQPPAPQMMSGDFSIGGLEAPEPVKAFVVTDEMTNSQNQLADIRRRATI